MSLKRWVDWAVGGVGIVIEWTVILRHRRCGFKVLGHRFFLRLKIFWRARFNASAASKSLTAWAWASSVSKLRPSTRFRSAPGRDLNFSYGVIFDLASGESAQGIAYANDRFYVFIRSGQGNKVIVFSATGEREPTADFDLAPETVFVDRIVAAEGRLFLFGGSESRGQFAHAYSVTGQRLREFDITVELYDVGPQPPGSLIRPWVQDVAITYVRYFTRRRASRVTDTARAVAESHTETPSGDTCDFSIRVHCAHLLSRYSCVPFRLQQTQHTDCILLVDIHHFCD